MNVQEVIHRSLLVTAGLLIGVVAAEAMARTYAHFGGEMGRQLARQDPLNVIIEPHGEWGYRQRPNLVHEYPNGARATSNAMGFRGPVVAVPKPPRVFRVILLGGSTTFGFQVEDDETIDAHMRHLLSERYPTTRFEVVNLALDGYDSYQIYQRLKSDGVALSPDLVILNTGINDVRNARYPDLKIPDPRTVVWAGNLEQLHDQAQRGGPSLRLRLGHYSYAIRLLTLIRGNLSRRAELALNSTVVAHPEAVDYFETNVRRAAELVEQAGAGLILSTPPSSLRTKYAPDAVSDQSYWIVNAATTQEYRDRLAARLQRLASEATARGWPATYLHLDLAPEFFQDDCHLTSDGNREVAKGFVNALHPFMERALQKPAL